jgi:hypothetical protein
LGQYYANKPTLQVILMFVRLGMESNTNTKNNPHGPRVVGNHQIPMLSDRTNALRDRPKRCIATSVTQLESKPVADAIGFKIINYLKA